MHRRQPGEGEPKAPYQRESGERKQGLKAAVDEERAEQPQAVVPEVLERQLEDVSPADAAQVDLLGGPVGGAAQHQELAATAGAVSTFAPAKIKPA